MMEFNDDGESDRLDYLYDVHQDFFDYLDFCMKIPELTDDWQNYLEEPDEIFLEQSNRNAQELLDDILGAE